MISISCAWPGETPWVIRGAALMLMLLSVAGPSQAEELEARLEWASRTQLGTLVEGLVAEVPVRVGQRVPKGTLLLALDTREARADLRRAEAELAEARLHQKEAEAELLRNQDLFDRTVLSQHDLQLAQIAAASGNAVLARAEAAEIAARVRLEHSTLRAPFTAWVIDLARAPGEVVINGLEPMPLVELADADHMLVSRGLDAGRAKALSVGDEVEVSIQGKHLPAHIRRVAMEPQDNTSQYLVEAEFEVPEGMSLRAGERALLVLP